MPAQPRHSRRPGAVRGARAQVEVVAARRDPRRLTHSTRHPRRITSRLVSSALAAVLGFVLVYAQTLSDQFEDAIYTQDISDLVDAVQPQDDGPADPLAGEALTIVVIGSDDRSGNNAHIGGEVGGMRNDATMVVHISGDRSRIDVVSIPRDAVVAVPDCRLGDGTVVKGWTGKFNIAFNNGGKQGDPAEAAACVINTIQSISHVTIDHFVVLDFTGFEAMIDALGGVPMCVPERIVGIDVDLELNPGPQVFDGQTALSYARLRKASEGNVSGSDIQRITRQQELVHATINTALSKNLLTDAGQLTQFLRAGAESLTMDETLGQTDYLIGLAYSLRNLDSDAITFVTVPWEYSEDFASVNILDEADQLWADLRADRPIVDTSKDAESTTELDMDTVMDTQDRDDDPVHTCGT